MSIIIHTDGDTAADTAGDTDGDTAADTAAHTDGDTDDIIKQNKAKKNVTKQKNKVFILIYLLASVKNVAQVSKKNCTTQKTDQTPQREICAKVKSQGGGTFGKF